jgi:diguanylate cyclase (GGDEF)-like protein/PAS domain S-box-containing protein
MNWLTPEMESLQAIVAAELDENGRLVKANAGFLRLIQMDGFQTGVYVDLFFIQPSFSHLVQAKAGADGEAYHGLLTMGNNTERTQSLRGRVWRAGSTLRVLAEYDIEELERLNNKVLELNQNYSKTQFELAQANHCLIASEKKFRTLYDLTSEAVMLLDDRGFFDCNAAALEMFECTTMDEFCTLHPADLSPPTQPCGSDSNVLANQRITTAKEKGNLRFDWMYRRVSTGEIFPAEVLLNSMDINGKSIILATVRDITARKKIEAQLQKLANIDPLTGLFNRRVFLERLEQERAKVARLSNYSVVLLMLDLDFFKRVNDTYGHASGDAVLKAFADVARNNSRTIDIPARLGGEEFAILLIGADKNDAQIMAERLRKQVEEIAIAHELGLVRITVSIGAACVLADDMNGEAVMQRADNALYEAKDNGRNQTRWFNF